MVKNLALEPGALLKARVVDDTTSQPLPGVWVGFRDFNQRNLMTDQLGWLQTRTAKGAEVVFWPLAEMRPDCIDDMPDRMAFFSGKVAGDRSDLVFHVRAVHLAPFTGKAADATGRAVTSATIVCHRGLQTAASNSLRVFSFKRAPKGHDFQLIGFTDDGKFAGAAPVRAGATTATLILHATASYEGLARTPEGLPAANLEFVAHPVWTSYMGPFRQSVTADANGKFTLRNICPTLT